ncbi:MAG: Na/Pi cotransporter family protein [Eubacteriales bacterium]|nr:Na/Pi cotransporter family protein [Eubacteriales bacterium]
MQIMDVLSLLGGLGLFLFGIKTMGEGLEKAAGHRMQRLLEALTRNRLMGVLVGALVTGVIQSSSATTVMVVGFVNAGLLSLSNAIGVIMGANIGTTVTSLMLSVKLNFGVIFAAFGGLCMLAGNRSGFKLLGQISLGLGVLFIGMETMTAAMQPLQSWEGFTALMSGVRNPVLGVLVGAGITALLQSSSASVGILQALAGSGAISLQAALFILFGQNIGTCVTALLASVGANRTARRAAVVHLLFNCIGAAIFIVIAMLLPFAEWVQAIAGDNLRLQIAVSHVIFNVTTTVLLLPLAGLLEKLACLVVRGQDKQEEPMRMTYFDDRLFSTPPIAAKQLFREVVRMSELARANLAYAMRFFRTAKELPLDEFNNREQVLDYLNAEITEKLIALRALDLGAHDLRLMGSLFHVVNDLERIGDHSMNIVEIGASRRKEKVKFSAKAEKEIDQLYDTVEAMVDQSIAIVRDQIIDPEVIGRVETLEAQVDELSETLANHHVERVKNKKCTPKNGMLYLDLLNNLERIADHADNLATSVSTGDNDNRLLW